MVCGACGRENAAGARFCDACGAPLTAVTPDAAARKVVTVLFTDVAGSTALGERLDPGLLRRVMWRYFDTVQGVLEEHGGTVEKFIGDAVMAVFGVPSVREDDALRAVRAASELGGRLQELNAELEDAHGVGIVTRTRVNTGEVIVGGGAADQSSRRATRSTSRPGWSRRRRPVRCCSGRRPIRRWRTPSWPSRRRRSRRRARARLSSPTGWSA